MYHPLAVFKGFVAVAIATSISFGHVGCSKELVAEDLPDDAQPVVPPPAMDAAHVVVERAPKPEPAPVSKLDPAKVEAAAAAFRRIDVHNRTDGQYSRFESGVIRTRKELDAFIEAEVASRPAFFKGIPRFLTALGEAKIDFSKEVLVLLRYTEPSISTKVRQGPTTLSLASQGKPLRNLRFRLQRNQPMAVADAVAEYCYPVIVDTTLVDTVSLEVDGQESYSVNLSKAPAIKVAPRVREKWEPAPPRTMNPPVNKPAVRLSYKQKRKMDPYKVDEYHRINGERNYHPTPSVRTTFKSPRKRSDGKIRVCIDEEGIIIRVTALKSTGYPEYDAELLELIKKEWRYRPWSEDGLRTLLPSCPEYVFVVPTSPFVPRSP